MIRPMNLARVNPIFACIAIVASVATTSVSHAACNSGLARETPDSAFTTEANGHVVTHAATGLTWRRCQLGMEWNGTTCTGIGSALNWRSALLAVQSINDGAGLAGKHDWRLPDLVELTTLVDHACHDPAINDTLFPNTAFPTPESDYFWSSTPESSTRGWAVRFQYGVITDYSLSGNTLRVRPVRGTLRGSPGGGSTTPPPASTVFVENFDNLDEINARGWLAGNLSEPQGEWGWFYGDDAVFPAQAGASTSLIAANYQSTGDNGTISNWLLTPLLDFRADSRVSFWTRTASGATYPDRLQVRVCLGDPCDMLGPGALGVQHYETLLLDINPNLLAGPDASGVNGYPDQWTHFELDAGDGVPQSGRGRIAFRYFVEDAGLYGTNSDYIGLDTVRIEGASVP